MFAVDDVLRIQNSAVAELLTALCLKGSDLGVRDPAALQYGGNLLDGNCQRFRVFALLMLLDFVEELLMHCLHDFHIEGVIQGAAERCLEALPLLRCGEGRFRMENGGDELMVYLIRRPGIEERIIDVCGPVIESGEEEAQLRL